MSIKEIKRFNNGLNGFLSKFICDSVLDLANMPTSENGVVIGSTVLCLENKTEYMLSNSDEWLEIRDAYATVTYVDGKISGVFRPSGNWNANTNTPTLANNESTNTGKVYYVTNAGTQFGLTFAIGDKLAFIEDGVATKWDNIDDVTTVNGKVGTVVINADDIPFDGSGTNYLTAKTKVESAVKELDTKVKTNADNVALKVNTSDIADNLTSTDTNKPLSANQGKVLQDTKADTTHTHTKSQITDFPTTMTPTAHTHTKSEITDFPTIPTIPDITVNNGNAESGKYISQVAVDETNKHKLNITKENLPTGFSGNYNDLTNQPTIPTVPTISIDITTDTTSDAKTASPKAVKTYVDNTISTVIGDIETLLEAI